MARVDARPLVGRDPQGRVRPYGYYIVPGFGFTYDPFWYSPGWGYYGYPYPYVVPNENSGGLRLEITPKTAQVFVDGNYAGVVDDFNGHFQHLDLTPGGHRINVRQPGFQRDAIVRGLPDPILHADRGEDRARKAARRAVAELGDHRHAHMQGFPGTHAAVLGERIERDVGRPEGREVLLARA